MDEKGRTITQSSARRIIEKTSERLSRVDRVEKQAFVARRLKNGLLPGGAHTTVTGPEKVVGDFDVLNVQFEVHLK